MHLIFHCFKQWGHFFSDPHIPLICLELCLLKKTVYQIGVKSNGIFSEQFSRNKALKYVYLSQCTQYIYPGKVTDLKVQSGKRENDGNFLRRLHLLPTFP